MKPSVLKLYMFIKKQMMEPDHPLNQIARKFVEYYVDFYSRQILMNSEKFHQKRDQEFNIITQAEAHEADPLKSNVIQPNQNESAILKMSVSSANKLAGMEQKPDHSYIGKHIEIRTLSMGYDGADSKEFAQHVVANTLPAKQNLTYTATPLENSQLTVNASMVSPS